MRRQKQQFDLEDEENPKKLKNIKLTQEETYDDKNENVVEKKTLQKHVI